MANISEFNEAIKIATPGTIITLKNGEWKNVHLKIFGNGTKEAPIVISAETNGEIIIKMAEDIEKPLSYLFRAEEGSRIQFKNLTIDVDGKTPVKYAVVSPDENMKGLYNLYINNCTIKNFSNTDEGAVFKVYVVILAETISIRNSKIEDSYRGLNHFQFFNGVHKLLGLKEKF